MKVSLKKPEGSRHSDVERRWPGYLLHGRIRTSTVVLIIAFVAVWWFYDTYREEPAAPVAPQVVPPGFIPDPAYTWVPRTRLQQPPMTATETSTPTTETTPPPSEATPPPSETEAPTPGPEFSFCPPLCPPSITAEPAPPGQVPPPSPGAPPLPSAPGAPQPSAAPGPATTHPATP